MPPDPSNLVGKLFDRKASLTIARAPSLTQAVLGTNQLNAIVITGMRIVFKLDKGSGKEPNTGTIEIYNLSEESRRHVQGKPIQIQLAAGYADRLKLLFVGDLMHAQSSIEGPDWVTRIQLGDGQRLHQAARVQKSFGKGVKTGDVVQALVKTMGQELPVSALSAPAMLKQYTGGVTVQGSAARELTRILAPTGQSWSIQNGQVQILSEGATRAEEAFVISAETGMIGSPEFGTPSKKGETPTLSVSNLLYPEILPGSKIRVYARAMPEGPFFKVESVSHSGDTHGADWTTTLTAKPL